MVSQSENVDASLDETCKLKTTASLDTDNARFIAYFTQESDDIELPFPFWPSMLDTSGNRSP